MKIYLFIYIIMLYNWEEILILISRTVKKQDLFFLLGYPVIVRKVQYMGRYLFNVMI